MAQQDSVNNIRDVELLSLASGDLQKMEAVETQIFEAYKYSYENDGVLAGENIQYDKATGTYYVTFPELRDSVFTMWSLRLSEKALILN